MVIVILVQNKIRKMLVINQETCEFVNEIKEHQKEKNKKAWCLLLKLEGVAHAQLKNLHLLIFVLLS